MKRAIDVEEVSADWLTAALGYKVRSVHSQKIGTGQMGTALRLSLDADQGPRTLIIKGAAGDPSSRQRVAGGYRREVGFYSQLVDTVDVRSPRCWYAAISDDAQQFTLLFEDLAPRRPGVQAQGCSVAQAQAAIRNLAGLHAPRWNDTALLDLEFLTRSSDPERARFLSEMTVATSSTFVERYREELAPEDVETMLASAEVIASWAFALAEPFSVVHGDYRLDNLMFGDDVGDVVALDWQTAEIGPPTRDLAYFLGTSLPVEERRRHERDLVGVYSEELISRGVENYDFEQCFNGYRVGQLQGPLTAAIGCAYATGERSEQSDGMFLAMARRSCAAIRDLETLDLIRNLA